MKKARVAFLDDEKMITDIFVDLFKSKYEVVTFSSGQEFEVYMSKYKSDQSLEIDVLVTDYNLGGNRTGLDVVEASLKKGFKVPFILLSGYLDKDTTIKAHDLGAHSILEKPINYKKLDDAIYNLLLANQINQIQSETKDMMLKLKEICSFCDLFLEKYIPKETIDEAFMSMTPQTKDKSGSGGQVIGFIDYLQRMEKQMSDHIRIEESLIQKIEEKKKSFLQAK